MFRPSGPDHMLIRTVMFCLFSLSFLQESESQCKTKRQNTTNHKMKVYKIVNLLPNFLKKGPPLRGKFPLLLHPELHLAENPPLLPSMVLVKTKEPGHLHWRAKVVAKENSDSQGWLLVTCSGFYSPSPLTGLIVMFVPCLNSSLEFILVTGLRFEILTPSFAFLLCGLKNTPVIAILKCSKVVISILPPCLSRMCFHKGLSAVFLWTSAM